MIKIRGFLYFADLYDCSVIPSGKELYNLAVEAVRMANMSPVKMLYSNFPEHFHKTEHGDSVISLIIPLEESHLCIHTWPHYRLISVDLYTCGREADAKKAIDNLIEAFKPKKQQIYGFQRGLLEEKE